MEKVEKDLAVERAAAFYLTMKRSTGTLVFSLATIIILPLTYVLQDGFTAGLWFFGAVSIGCLLGRWRRPTKVLVKFFEADEELQAIVKKHLQGVHSESSLWIAILPPLYALAVSVLVPAVSGTMLPNDAIAMLLLSGFCGVMAFNFVHAVDMVKAGKIERIAKSFAIPERVLRNRVTEKNPLAPRTLSANCAAAFFFVLGALSLFVGGFFLITLFLTVPIYLIESLPMFERLAFGLLFILMPGLGSFYTGRLVRMMNRGGAILGVLLCVMFMCVAAAPLDPHLSYLFLQPAYLNVFWLWPVPIAVVIVLWRNWGRMRWRESDLYEIGLMVPVEREKDEFEIPKESWRDRKEKTEKKMGRSLLKYFVTMAVVMIAIEIATSGIFGGRGSAPEYNLAYNLTSGWSYDYDVRWEMEYPDFSSVIDGTETIAVADVRDNECDILDRFDVEVDTRGDVPQTASAEINYGMIGLGVYDWPDVDNVEPLELYYALWDRYAYLGWMLWYPDTPASTGEKWNWPVELGFWVEDNVLWTNGYCNVTFAGLENVTVAGSTFACWRLTHDLWSSGELAIGGETIKRTVSCQATTLSDSGTGMPVRVNWTLDIRTTPEGTENARRENFTMELVRLEAP